MPEPFDVTYRHCGEPLLPNLSQADADGCLWICIDPDCPELCAGEVDSEKAAHRFAAAFLVPGDTARRELGIVSRRTAASQLADMRAWGWEDAEPSEGVAAEVPARLERLVLRALAEGEVTESRASELLAVPADALRTRLRCA